MNKKSQKTVDTGYIPRPLQKELHSKLKRFNILVLHRRFGKSTFAINESIDQGLRLYTSKKLPRPRYAYIAPTYGMSKRIAWDIYKTYCGRIPGATFNEQELRVDISLFNDPSNTLRFQLLGAENPDSLRGIYLDGVVVDEPANTSPSLWSHVIRPTLLDRNGWAIFVGTPAGRNHFYDFYERASVDPEWFCQTYAANETGVIPQAELDALLREMGEESYGQEMLCSWNASNKGSYYGPKLTELRAQGRITKVPYDESVGVIASFDLGISDSTAVWFAQRVNKEIHLIDYMEVDGLGIPDIVRKIKEKPYVYSTYLFPHDVMARELGTGKTRVEVLRKLGIVADVLPRQKVDDGIQATRLMLSQCWFDEEKTRRGLDCLQNYKREWNEKSQYFETKPSHDWASHGSDSFRYLAMGIDRERGLTQNKKQEKAVMEYDVFARNREGFDHERDSQ